jgi:hypothetical protein
VDGRKMFKSLSNPPPPQPSYKIPNRLRPALSGFSYSPRVRMGIKRSTSWGTYPKLPSSLQTPACDCWHLNWFLILVCESWRLSMTLRPNVGRLGTLDVSEKRLKHSACAS